MRLLIVAVVLLAATAHAQPVAGPPSKTLERAIKLYDKQDFYSATVELQKVLDGESGDDAANKQRAEFFMGKSLFQLKYYVASLAMFDRISNNSSHTYYRASIKWLVAIADVVPGISPRAVLREYQPDDVDDPILDPRTRDAFHYYYGRMLADHNDPRAATQLRLAGGTHQARAAVELAKAAFRAQRVDDAIEQIAIAARDPAVIDDAVHVLATWTRLLKMPDHARDALSRLGHANDLALLESSRLGAMMSWYPDFAGVSLETFAAISIATTCTQGPNSEDAVPALRATVEDLRARVGKLAAYDDNAEVYEAVEKMMAGSAVLRLAILDPDTRDERGFVIELARELSALQRSDKAWQTTQIAAIVLQELTVQASVAAADVGKRYRTRLEHVGRELALLARAFGKGSAALALGPPVRPGRGITVMSKLCSSQLGMPVSAVATQSTIPATQPRKATGCAGCTSGAGGGWSLVLLVAAAITWSKLQWGTILARASRRTSTSRR